MSHLPLLVPECIIKHLSRWRMKSLYVPVPHHAICVELISVLAPAFCVVHTAASTVVYECPNSGACIGGTDQASYCEEGFKGRCTCAICSRRLVTASMSFSAVSTSVEKFLRCSEFTTVSCCWKYASLRVSTFKHPRKNVTDVFSVLF